MLLSKFVHMTITKTHTSQIWCKLSALFSIWSLSIASIFNIHLQYWPSLPFPTSHCVPNLPWNARKKRRCVTIWSPLPEEEIISSPISCCRRPSISWPINMEHGALLHRGKLEGHRDVTIEILYLYIFPPPSLYVRICHFFLFHHGANLKINQHFA